MSKTLSAASSITIGTSGTVSADTTWIQSSGLIDCSAVHGLNVEFKVTFTDNADVSGDVYLYIVGSNDGGTDITSASQAIPIGSASPVQNTTITSNIFVPVEYGDFIGFGVKNNDPTYSVDVTCSYKTVTF